MRVDPRDLSAADALRGAGALGRFRLQDINDPDDPAFEAAFGMLDSFFGPRGELEPREALAAFVRRRSLAYGPGMEGRYHLIAAWDGDRLAGVRDCYVDLDHEAGVCLAALSHSFVAPPWRRSGLAALLRAVPATLARATVAETWPDRPEAPILLAAEMEPADPEDPDTVVRLLAYGRSGFSVADPRRLPYSQPDFRDVEALGLAHLAIPLLPVVRRADRPEDRVLPVHVAAAFPRLFHICHRMYLPQHRVDPSEVHALRALSRAAEPVPLLALPRSAEELDRLAPLVRGAVLPLYPPNLRGPNPAVGDPAEQLARLLRR